MQKPCLIQGFFVGRNRVEIKWKYNRNNPSLPALGRQARGNRGLNSYFDGIFEACLPAAGKQEAQNEIFILTT
jgi:hypothetical protein